MKIWVTGGQGQVASALSAHPRAAQHTLTLLPRAVLDITDSAAIEQALSHATPDIVVNTAAYTAVDQAEKEPEKAFAVNRDAAGLIAAACAKRKIPLIHLSTDYVFSGEKREPYDEQDRTAPCNTYGLSKCEGEVRVQDAHPSAIILRVSSIFSRYGHNFVKTIARLAQQQAQLRVVDDQWMCPTSADDLAGVIFQLCESPALADHTGIYHYCNRNAVSWHQFAQAIVEATRLSKTVVTEKILAVTTAEYPTLAKRPVYSVLNCGKLKTHFGIEQRDWQDALPQLIKELSS